MRKNVSTEETKRLYDLCRQYDVFEPWLKENGFALEDLPLTAKNESGEDIIVDAYKDDEDKTVWKMTTVQSNGWLRINCYHEDGIVEEMYKR